MRAIGYRGVPLPDVPFDERRRRHPQRDGPCARATTLHRSGEYVVGWIKRGPTGVIGTNKKDAQETVDSLLEDLAAGRIPEPAEPDPATIESTLRARVPKLVTYAGWDQIDRHERGLGEPHGRPRVKLTRIEEMLEIAARQHPDAGEPQSNGDQPEADGDGDPERRSAHGGRPAAPMAD